MTSRRSSWTTDARRNAPRVESGPAPGGTGAGPSAYEAALRLLSARAYSVRDLRRKLSQKDFPPHEVHATVERLVANGMLDDFVYAQQYARRRLTSTAVVNRRLVQQLQQRGIARETAEAAVAEMVRDEAIDVDAAIERDVRRKLARLKDLDPLIVRRRMYAHLARRGHDPGAIRRILERIL